MLAIEKKITFHLQTICCFCCVRHVRWKFIFKTFAMVVHSNNAEVISKHCTFTISSSGTFLWKFW